MVKRIESESPICLAELVHLVRHRVSVIVIGRIKNLVKIVVM